MENEFLCRSYLYKENTAGLEYNCQLYHLDHNSMPDGPSTFLTTDRPLLDDGEPVGKFVENVCASKFLLSLSRGSVTFFVCSRNLGIYRELTDPVRRRRRSQRADTERWPLSSSSSSSSSFLQRSFRPRVGALL